MKIIKDINSVRRNILFAKSRGKKIGFVPTMGYLHEGHASLLRQCKKENDISVLSVFVNPKQFGPNEDFKEYPRDYKKDELLAKKEKVDIIFHPSIKEMYPDERSEPSGYLTSVEVERLGNCLCGKSRPGHFKGVTTVVAKLLNIVSPDVLYLGQKDAQQVVIIRTMMEDLNFPSNVKVLATVREKDGLAMSSRNRYLTPLERKEAPILFQALRSAKEKILDGERNPDRIIEMIRSMISKNSNGRIDYIECLKAKTLEPMIALSGEVLIALAVWFNQTRLIDNILVRSQ